MFAINYRELGIHRVLPRTVTVLLTRGNSGHFDRGNYHMNKLFKLDVALFGKGQARHMWAFDGTARRSTAPDVFTKAPSWARLIAESSIAPCRFVFLSGNDPDKNLQAQWVGGGGFSAARDHRWHSAEVLARRDPQAEEFDVDRLGKAIAAAARTASSLVKLEGTPESGEGSTGVARPTIYHAPDVYRDATLLLEQTELTVWRSVTGELHHAPTRDVLINPSLDGVAAEVLSRLSDCDIAPEHIAELRAQGLI